MRHADATRVLTRAGGLRGCTAPVAVVRRGACCAPRHTKAQHSYASRGNPNQEPVKRRQRGGGRVSVLAWRSRRSPQPCDYVRSRACSAAARLRVSLRTPCASSASYQEEHIRCGSSRDKSFRRPLTRRPTCWATSCRRCARRPPRSLRPQPTCPTCRGPRPGRPKALPTARRGAPSARTAT